ncbi:MAG: hypothetical protein H6918_05100 [Sphingomonadaceae bacterium]|nr:hypothetical protein [Sphingomonadaceae bacterium]
MKKLIAFIGLLWLTLTTTPALAQIEGQWQGTWKTTYGELRLREDRGHVWGDYGDLGQIEGRLSADRQTFRGVFRRNNGNSGYLEMVQSGDDGNRFIGRWKWQKDGFPNWKTEDGRFWRGDRISSEVPQLTQFTNFISPGRFVARLQSDPRNWVAFRNGPRVATSSTGGTRSQTGQAAHPWASRMPIFEGYPADFMPTSFTVGIANLTVHDGRAPATVFEDGLWAELYGNIGIYAYCHTASGSRELKPYGSRPNRIFSRGRDKFVKVSSTTGYSFGTNEGRRTFPLDRACLAQPSGRIVVQIQSNLVERDLTPRLDDKFGYKADDFYLDQFPTSRLPAGASTNSKKVGKILLSVTSGQTRSGTFRYSEPVNARRNYHVDFDGDLTFNR